MALIECGECSGKLSDKAPACPHCGAPPTTPPPVTGTNRVWLIVIAGVASTPALILFAMGLQNMSRGHNAGPIFMGLLWTGAVVLAYTLINRTLDKAAEVARAVRDRANASTRFATDQVERRTVATERHVDAETIGHVAGAGKLADESDTARKWTTRTDAFGRVVGDDDDDHGE